MTRIPPECFLHPHHCSGASAKPNVRTYASLNSVSGRASFRHLLQNPGNADDDAPCSAKPPGWESVAIFVFGLNCAIGGKCNPLASVLRQTIGRRSCYYPFAFDEPIRGWPVMRSFTAGFGWVGLNNVVPPPEAAWISMVEMPLHRDALGSQVKFALMSGTEYGKAPVALQLPIALAHEHPARSFGPRRQGLVGLTHGLLLRRTGRRGWSSSSLFFLCMTNDIYSPCILIRVSFLQSSDFFQENLNTLPHSPPPPPPPLCATWKLRSLLAISLYFTWAAILWTTRTVSESSMESVRCKGRCRWSD